MGAFVWLTRERNERPGSQNAEGILREPQGGEAEGQKHAKACFCNSRRTCKPNTNTGLERKLMSRNSSAAEVKKKHLDTLGEELGSVYTALYNEVTWLHLQWDEYMELFGQKHRVKLLNNAASGFFRMIQSTLSDDVMIGIARLTDPIITHASKEKKYNLTILTLPNLMEPAEKEALEFLIKEAMDAAAFCRDWRNRRLAHRDLPLSLQKKNAAPLPPATVDKIEAALKGLAEVIRFIGFKRFDTDIRFDHIIRANGAERLLYVLNDGLKKHKERLDKMRSGIYDPKDHHERI